MDRNTAISRIQRGLGFRTDLNDEIALALQEQQRLLEQGKTLPKFMKEEDQTISVVASTQSYFLPERFIRVSDEESVYWVDSDNVSHEIVRRPFAEARGYYSETDAGAPEAYSIRKDTIYFWPVPDTGYSVVWTYYKGGELLTSNVENTWLANVPDLLIGLAGISIATDVRDKDAFATFTALAQAAAEAMLNNVALDELSDMPVALGRNN